MGCRPRDDLGITHEFDYGRPVSQARPLSLTIVRLSQIHGIYNRVVDKQRPTVVAESVAFCELLLIAGGYVRTHAEQLGKKDRIRLFEKTVRIYTKRLGVNSLTATC